jgi:hypothetical protein
MAVEIFDGGWVVTGEHISLLRLKMLKRAMESELKFGMKMTRACPFKIVRNEFGITARPKQKVYDSFCSMLSAKGLI